MRSVRSPYKSSLACATWFAAWAASAWAVRLPAAPAFNALPGTLVLTSPARKAASFVEIVLVSDRAAASDSLSVSTVLSRLSTLASLAFSSFLNSSTCFVRVVCAAISDLSSAISLFAASGC